VRERRRMGGSAAEFRPGHGRAAAPSGRRRAGQGAEAHGKQDAPQAGCTASSRKRPGRPRRAHCFSFRIILALLRHMVRGRGRPEPPANTQAGLAALPGRYLPNTSRGFPGYPRPVYRPSRILMTAAALYQFRALPINPGRPMLATRIARPLRFSYRTLAHQIRPCTDRAAASAWRITRGTGRASRE